MKYLALIIGSIGYGLLVAFAGWGVTIGVALVAASVRLVSADREDL